MVYIHYKLGLKSSRQPQSIYQGTIKIGEIERTYKNSFIYWLDTIALKGNWFISYAIRDTEGNTVINAKDTSTLLSRQFNIHYQDADLINHLISLKHQREINLSYNIYKFTFKGETYCIKKEKFKPANLIWNDIVIAEWNIAIFNRTVKIQIFEKLLDEPLLVLVLFHSAFGNQR